MLSALSRFSDVAMSPAIPEARPTETAAAAYELAA